MSKTLADILRSYIPDGDGYNSEYAHNLSAAADALESQQSAPAGYVMVPVELIDSFPEINPNNYSHDQVCDLNAWGCDLVLAAIAAAPKADVQEPVATVTIQHFRQDPRMENVDFQLQVTLPQGTHKLYAAPQPSDGARDAARYRWLLDKSGFGIRRNGVTELTVAFYEVQPDNIGQLSFAIDAAMGSKGDE